jgi:hypothetical protein
MANRLVERCCGRRWHLGGVDDRPIRVCSPRSPINIPMIAASVIPSSQGIVPRLRGAFSDVRLWEIAPMGRGSSATVLACAPQTARDPSASVGMTTALGLLLLFTRLNISRSLRFCHSARLTARVISQISSRDGSMFPSLSLRHTRSERPLDWALCS